MKKSNHKTKKVPLLLQILAFTCFHSSEVMYDAWGINDNRTVFDKNNKIMSSSLIPIIHSGFICTTVSVYYDMNQTASTLKLTLSFFLVFLRQVPEGAVGSRSWCM